MGFTEREVVQHQGCLISSINQSIPKLEFNVSSLFVFRVVVLGDDVSENYWLHDLMLDFSPLPSGKIVHLYCILYPSWMLQSRILLSTSLKSVLDF